MRPIIEIRNINNVALDRQTRLPLQILPSRFSHVTHSLSDPSHSQHSISHSLHFPIYSSVFVVDKIILWSCSVCSCSSVDQSTMKICHGSPSKTFATRVKQMRKSETSKGGFPVLVFVLPPALHHHSISYSIFY